MPPLAGFPGRGRHHGHGDGLFTVEGSPRERDDSGFPDPFADQLELALNLLCRERRANARDPVFVKLWREIDPPWVDRWEQT